MASWGTSLASSPRSERASLGASPRTAPGTRQDLRTAAEAFAQAVELMDKQVAFMSFRAALLRWCVRQAEQDLSPDARAAREAERIALLDEEVGAGTLLACMAALPAIKTPVRFNQVAECEGILEQWHVEYQANTAQRKSWLCPSGESFRESWTGSDTRFAVSEMPVTKRRGRKRKILGATLCLGAAGAAVTATGTVPLVLSLFTKTAAAVALTM